MAVTPLSFLVIWHTVVATDVCQQQLQQRGVSLVQTKQVPKIASGNDLMPVSQAMPRFIPNSTFAENLDGGASAAEASRNQTKDVKAPQRRHWLHSMRGTSGFMTSRGDGASSKPGYSCGFANADNGGVGAPSATSPYFANRMYCTANAAIYRGGYRCGACLRVSGVAGSHTVQIVGSGASDTLDCEELAFQAISGHSGGKKAIEYEPTECETDGGAVATVLKGGSAAYTQIIFSNLPRAVIGAQMIIDHRSFTMKRVTGAGWEATLAGKAGKAGFEVMLEDNELIEIKPCFDYWPVATGVSCDVGTRPPPSIKLYVLGGVALVILIFAQYFDLLREKEKMHTGHSRRFTVLQL